MRPPLDQHIPWKIACWRANPGLQIWAVPLYGRADPYFSHRQKPMHTSMSPPSRFHGWTWQKKPKHKVSNLCSLILFNTSKAKKCDLCQLHCRSTCTTVFSPIEPPGGKAVVWGGCIRNDTKMGISRPKMVEFSFCKKGFEEKSVLFHLRI